MHQAESYRIEAAKKLLIYDTSEWQQIFTYRRNQIKVENAMSEKLGCTGADLTMKYYQFYRAATQCDMLRTTQRATHISHDKFIYYKEN